MQTAAISDAESLIASEQYEEARRLLEQNFPLLSAKNSKKLGRRTYSAAENALRQNLVQQLYRSAIAPI